MVRTFGWLAKFAFFGLLTVVLIGPVVGLMGVLLPFAIIGGSVWLLVRGVRRLFTPRRPIEVPAAEEAPAMAAASGSEGKVWAWGCLHGKALSPEARERLVRAGKRLGEACGRGVAWCRDAGPVMGAHVRAAGEGALTGLRRAARVLGETFYGAAAGGLLAWAVAGWEQWPILGGTLAGGLLGVIVGIATAQSRAGTAVE
jgi:hypothetical protein